MDLSWDFPLTAEEQAVNMWALRNRERRLHLNIAEQADLSGATEIAEWHRQQAANEAELATEALRSVT